MSRKFKQEGRKIKLEGRTRYGSWFTYNHSDLDIELYMVQQGGHYERDGNTYGNGLAFHMEAMMRLIWPDEEIDPWARLAIESFCKEKVTVLIGPKDCAKTNNMAKCALCDWWAFPEDTLWLISSTTRADAQRRIWGRIKSLFNRAKRRFPELPGRAMESADSIINERDDDRAFANELDKGLVLVPCKRGNDFVGLSSFIGTKAKRLRHAGDEVSLMPDGFLNAYSNFTGETKNFKGIMAGNPTDLLDSICKAACPKGGWETFSDTKKTMQWRSGFFDAWVVNYDGRDTPNNLFPYPPARYPYLITPRDVDAIIRTNGPDSWLTHMQAYGKPNRILESKRVITHLLCEQSGAFLNAVWSGTGRIKIMGLDPAYGGGDECISIEVEFGEDSEGVQILKVNPPEVIPINVSVLIEPDDQIANWVQARCLEFNIEATNVFYGAFGKGTLGYAFSRRFGAACPVPIDEGGPPTKRPVRDGLYVQEPGKDRRLVRCDEYYDRRISQLWYDTRLVIEGRQMRELPRDVMDEGCLRTFSIVKGHKVSVETKDDLKRRMQGESPNKFDALTFAVAGALTRGFRLRGLKPEGESASKIKLAEVRTELHTVWKSRTPSYA